MSATSEVIEFVLAFEAQLMSDEVIVGTPVIEYGELAVVDVAVNTVELTRYYQTFRSGTVVTGKVGGFSADTEYELTVTVSTSHGQTRVGRVAFHALQGAGAPPSGQ